jgi:hypothetical protein
VSDHVLDASRSRVRIQTFAEGLLARLAHDLELVCGELSGTATTASDGGKTTGTASVAAPLRGIVMAGVLGRDGRVDPRGLSPSDQRDVIAKMQHDVFHGGPDAVVRVEAHHDGGSARIRVIPPNGKAVETVVRPDVELKGDDVHAKGTFEISLAAIGSDAVKGPMGAFRVKDRVKIIFDVWFARAPRVE